MMQESEKLSDLDLLKLYAKQWDQYTMGANYVNKLFNYLNKHWVKREKDEGRKEVYTVYTVCLCYVKSLVDALFVALPSSLETELLQILTEQPEWHKPLDPSVVEADRTAEEWRGGGLRSAEACGGQLRSVITSGR